MKEFREPSTLKINREQKKKAKERLQSLGLTLEGAVATFWEFAIHSEPDEIYAFMSRNVKKPIIVALLLIAFLGIGMYVTHFGERITQWATSEHLYDTIQGDPPF